MDLLAHIGAPTSRASDERYKAQAAAYANYEPSTHVHIGQHDRSIREAKGSHRSQGRGSKATVNLLGRQLNEQGLGVAARRSPLERLEILQQAWRRDSRPPRRAVGKLAAPTTEVESEWGYDTQLAASVLESQLVDQQSPDPPVHPPSEIEGPSTKRRKTGHTGQSDVEIDVSLELYVPHTVGSPIVHGVSSPKESLGGARKRQRSPMTPDQDSMTSLLPSVYSLSDTTTDTSSKRSQRPALHDPTMGALDDQPRTASPTVEARAYYMENRQSQLTASTGKKSASCVDHPSKHPQQHTQAQSIRQPLQTIRPNASPHKAAEAGTPGPSSRTARQVNAPSKPQTYPTNGPAPKLPCETQDTTLSPLASNARPQQGHPNPTAPTTQRHPRPLRTLPLEARSPPPPSPSSQPRSHITRKLQTLRDLPALASRYAAASAARGVEVVAAGERGRWEFTVRRGDEAAMRRWPAGQQARFWESLCGLVRDGSLGWCVWCVRQPLDDDDGDDDGGGDDAARLDPLASDGEALGRVRVFCYGEVVQHMWLLLYTLSDNRIRKLSLQWIDSKGNVIVQAGGPTGAAAT